MLIAPGVTDEALNVTKTKENIRVLNTKELGLPAEGFKYLSVTDGMLVQGADNGIVKRDDLKIVQKNSFRSRNTELFICLESLQIC